MAGLGLLRLEGDDQDRGEGGWRRRLSGGGRSGARRVRTPRGGNTATLVIIGVCVIVFLAEMAQGVGVSGTGGSSLIADGALFGPAVADGEWWRLVTSSFLHAGLIHLGFNMLLLYWLGSALESYAGTDRFLAIWFSAVLWGAAGALLLSPNAVTVGASGGVFGLMAAIFFLERQRGFSLMQSEVGALLLLNLGITFILPGISIGGHLGGIVGGAAAAFILSGYGKGSLAYGQLGASGALGLAALTVGGIAVSLYAV
jgi:membrane associated rhomboid family serine protease